MSRTASTCLSVLLAGCATTLPAQNGRRASAEFESVTYDGETLKGHLLIRAEDEVVLDRRMLEGDMFEASDIKECLTQSHVPYVAIDVIRPPPSPQQLLTLAPGEWFGRDVTVHLFEPLLMDAPAPACIDYNLYIRLPFAGSPTARVQGRAQLHKQ